MFLGDMLYFESEQISSSLSFSFPEIAGLPHYLTQLLFPSIRKLHCTVG